MNSPRTMTLPRFQQRFVTVLGCIWRFLARRAGSSVGCENWAVLVAGIQVFQPHPGYPFSRQRQLCIARVLHEPLHFFVFSSSQLSFHKVWDGVLCGCYRTSKISGGERCFLAWLCTCRPPSLVNVVVSPHSGRRGKPRCGRFLITKHSRR